MAGDVDVSDRLEHAKPKNVNNSFLAIVNPVAGGGRGRKLLGPALDRLRAGGLEIEVAETHAPREATRIAREAYGRGLRQFLSLIHISEPTRP